MYQKNSYREIWKVAELVKEKQSSLKLFTYLYFVFYKSLAIILSLSTTFDLDVTHIYCKQNKNVIKCKRSGLYDVILCIKFITIFTQNISRDALSQQCKPR